MKEPAVIGNVGIIAGRTAAERGIHIAKVLGNTVTQNIWQTSLTLVLDGVEKRGKA